jgi:hypothetical protein
MFGICFKISQEKKEKERDRCNCDKILILVEFTQEWVYMVVC